MVDRQRLGVVGDVEVRRLLVAHRAADQQPVGGAVGRRARGTRGRATRRARRCRRCRRSRRDRQAGSNRCRRWCRRGSQEHRSSRAPVLRYGRPGGEAHRAVHIDRNPRPAGTARTRSGSRPRAGGSHRPFELQATRPCPTGSPRPSGTSTGCSPTATAVRSCPFAQRRLDTGELVGCTRYLELRHWRGRTAPDEVEIGGTWLAATAQRTAVNTEAKLLLLTHAFEQWDVWRVAICTDARQPAQPGRDRAARRPVRGHPALAPAGEPTRRDATARHRHLLDHHAPSGRPCGTGLVARLARAGGSAPPSGSYQRRD